MWEEMWENGPENPLFIFKRQYLTRWFGTSPATIATPCTARAPALAVRSGIEPAEPRRIRCKIRRFPCLYQHATLPCDDHRHKSW